ncbi:AP-4 complex subunit epsilon-1 [Microtus ochrogaster]|uniref:AP-4 complex subunit epsilon-1 n=1 Tax=Microtus ochrogaster TaxID=79684 RepID=A0A8J6G2V0_MICOH|nr:AP-4 complex subunit epsilon-1 [Microtus ochrogaster]
MSDMVERTLTALPGLFLQNQLGGPAASRAPFFSRLGGLIRGVTALSSKHEEEKLIQQELSSLKATVSAPTTTLKMMKECMVRLIYCEMLGYDASFGYIHAIKLAQQGNLLEKRVGYLAVSLFLHESHELLLLLVNTVVKDLQSTNLVEVCMALTVVSQIFPREMIPAVLPLIEDKLQHSKEIIRRKAVLALYKFYVIAPNQVQHIHTKFRKALCDRDVGVMASSLHIYLRMIKVLGEYSYLLGEESAEEVITRLYKLLMSDSISSETKAWLIAAVTKLTPQAHSSHIVEKLIQEFTVSLDTCLRQHAFELKHLHENVELMKTLLQDTQNCEDPVVDASLSFLDGFVAEGLSQGAAPYKPHHQRQEEQLSQEKVLNFEPYGLSFSSSGFTGRQSPAGISLGSDISGNSAETGLKETSSLKLEGIKKLWGKEGYLPKKESSTGDKMEVPHAPGEGTTMENVSQATARKDQAQGLTLSTEEKEKQLLASSLFVGLEPENTINLLGKADLVSHKFRRKSKFKVSQNDKIPSAHNPASSTLSSVSVVARGDDDCLSALNRGDTELSAELLGSGSSSELSSVEKLSSVSSPAPSLFADDNMEVFQPSSSSTASAAASLLEETPERGHSSLMEICSNDTVSVSSYKIWKDDCLLVVWAVTSKTDSEVTNAKLEIFPVENFKPGKKFGVVVVGVGRAGSVRIRDLQDPHSLAFLNLIGFVSRRELGSLDEVRQISLEDALCSQEIDVAYICSESSSHEDYIRQFLQAGKHVLVEYPITLSFAAAQELWELAAQKGKVLHEEHLELLMEEFAFLKKEVTGKELLKGSLHFTASPLDEEKFGFPAFSGISRLTWLVCLFGELSLISATLEDRKEDQTLCWIEEKAPCLKRNRYLNFQFKSGSLENVPNVGIDKKIFLKDQDLFIQKLLGQVSAEDLAAEKKRIMHCLGLADHIQKLCRPEK